MIAQVLVIFVTAVAGGFLAHRFHQPLISGYLLAAIIVAALFGKVISLEANQAVGQLGLTLLLFSLGLEFSFRRLARVKTVAVIGGLTQVLVTTAVFTVVFLGMGMPPPAALVLAYGFSMASTAVVTKVLAEKGQADTLPGEIAVGWLMVQDMAVIPGLILIGQIGKTPPMAGQVGLIGVAILKSAVLLYLVVFLGKKILPKVLDRVSRVNNRELFSIAIILIILLSAAGASFAGLSMAIGAFIAGLIIAESAQNHVVFAEIRPLRDVFAVVFFVGMGLGMDLSYLSNWANLINLILVTGVVFLVKILAGILVTLRFGYHLKTAFEVGFSLSGVGEFALVLGLTAVGFGVISAADNALLSGVAILGLGLSPLFAGLGLPIFEKTRKIVGRWSPRLYKALFSEFDSYKKQRGEIDLSNHVVICGHGRVGKQIARVLTLAGVPYAVVDYNHEVIAELTSAGVETVLGDPAEIEVLRFARVPQALAVVAAVPDKHSQELVISHALTLKPGIPIVCRSHFDEDKGRLYAMGANYVVQPEMEAGLTMGHKLLDTLGFKKETINEYVKQVRREQER